MMRLIDSVKRLLLGLSMVSCSFACSSASDTAEQNVEPAVATEKLEGRVYGKLLHRVELAGDHVLEFYEVGHGLRGARESYGIDSGVESRLEGVKSATLAELYRIALPETAEYDVPAAITDADQRAQVYEALVAEKMGPTHFTSDVDLEAARPVEDNESSSPVDPVKSFSQGLTACSADFFGDQWGAQWFLDNFYSGNIRRHGTNLPNASSGIVSASAFTWKQMEGDFNNAGHSHGEYRYYDCCTLCASCALRVRTLWDFDVLPRRVEIQSWVGKVYYYGRGNSPCAHLHYVNALN